MVDDVPLTKAQLDELTVSWRRWREEMGAPVDAPKPAAKALPSALSTREKALLAGIAPIIHDLETQTTELRARIAELESSTLKYCGVYQPSASYQRGCVVTCDGSAFHATRAVNSERPGTSDAWQLMVKHGKDAPTPTPRSETATAHPRENGHYSRPRTP